MNTILIADRESAHRQQIRRHIDSHSEFRVIGECGSCRETVQYVNALEPDVLFLDVQLAGGRTFELFQQADHLPKVIYTAQNESYALQAFNHQALDYLLKPFAAERLDAALQKVVDRTVTPPFHGTHLFVEDGERMRRIALHDIRYLKAAGDYTVVYSDKGEFVSSSGIGSIERKLDPSRFMRVHRSFIVNLEHIDACHRDIGRLYLIMENGQEIRVGKHYLHQIKSLIL
ncbi:response regulator transcription factor [Sphingobacterium alkalisoli]|uniref:Response regulator transcription factor n=1 Tax=Sphingobacterium alkalisoli TaxID=1874115 RepID=A0A4U0H2Q4_9SPHI|nr:LytTR family DNA-binding domain-containing protein [Sphingobacterium alkalisoli]TJY64542.1 response regulator transcription factor [Sphingobacterium alkalisoli]GGH21081.1 DNA-binding response regulator [Sphingobacterium alkalisoli]